MHKHSYAHTNIHTYVYLHASPDNLVLSCLGQVHHSGSLSIIWAFFRDNSATIKNYVQHWPQILKILPCNSKQQTSTFSMYTIDAGFHATTQFHINKWQQQQAFSPHSPPLPVSSVPHWDWRWSELEDHRRPPQVVQLGDTLEFLHQLGHSQDLDQHSERAAVRIWWSQHLETFHSKPWWEQWPWRTWSEKVHTHTTHILLKQ